MISTQKQQYNYNIIVFSSVKPKYYHSVKAFSYILFNKNVTLKLYGLDKTFHWSILSDALIYRCINTCITSIVFLLWCTNYYMNDYWYCMDLWSIFSNNFIHVSWWKWTTPFILKTHAVSALFFNRNTLLYTMLLKKINWIVLKSWLS